MNSPLPEKNRPDWENLTDYRPARLSDLDAIMEIELQSFRTPTRRDSYEKEIGLDFYFKRVAELKQGARVAGYSFSIITPPEASIATIAVDGALRKQGLGTYFLGKILDDFKIRGIREVWLDARAHNRAALALYQKSGFVRVGVRAGYYQDTGEDALVMKKELS